METFMFQLLSLLENYSKDYTPVQSFVITAWGKLLYLDYFSLPSGKDFSNSSQLLTIAKEYESASDKEKFDLDEWISEGCPMKNGSHILNVQTVDAVLTSCQRAVKNLVLYRFDSSSEPVVPNAWISMTVNSNGKYSGKKSEFNISDLVIDTKGMADDGEYIVSTNVLRKGK